MNLTPEEKRVFGQLFKQADLESLGVVTGEVAVKFFERTRLPPAVLGEVSLLGDTLTVVNCLGDEKWSISADEDYNICRYGRSLTTIIEACSPLLAFVWSCA